MGIGHVMMPGQCQPQISVGVLSGQLRQQLSSALFLVFAGFVLTALAMMAAQEGLIDRVWLDKLLLELPDKQALTATLNALLG